MRITRTAVFKWRASLAVTALALGGASVLGTAAFTPAAHADVISGNCPTAHYEVRTCVDQESNGQYLGGGTPLDAPHIIQECLGMNGGGQFACTAYQTTGAGQTLQLSATPPSAGSVCAITWESNGNGTSTEVGDACM